MLNDVIVAQTSSGRKWVEELDKKMHKNGTISENWIYKFVMSPGDLMYVPNRQEIANQRLEWSTDRIYKVVSLDGENPNFIHANIASVIIDGKEYTRHNKTSRDEYDQLIKEICIPIKVDRLGNIKNISL